MSVQPLFRWRGDYLGFRHQDFLFFSDGRYLGWVDARGRCWSRDGAPLGELVEGCYILRRLAWTQPVRQTPKVPPVPPQPPLPPAPRAQRQPRPGWTDALEPLGHLPGPDALAGVWDGGGARFDFGDAGHYTLLTDSGEREQGAWSLRATRLILRPAGTADAADGDRPVYVYQVLEFTPADDRPARLSLRRLGEDVRALPFTLTRLPGAAG